MLIIDDVITAGTAVREVMTLIEQHNARPAGVVIALNRQEKGTGDLSAIQEVERDYGVPVVSIITLNDLMDYLHTDMGDADLLRRITNYRQQYGVE